LATKEKLFHKGITQDPFCPFCLEHIETASHLLWSCPSSEAVWQECSRRIQKLAFEDSEGMGLIKNLQEKLVGEELLEAFMVLRLIWMRRNSYVFQGVFTPPHQIIFMAKEQLAVFSETTFRGTEGVAATVPSLDIWHSPPGGWVKLNWDAALNKHTKLMGIYRGSGTCGMTKGR